MSSPPPVRVGRIHLRVARPADAAHVLGLIRGLARFEKLEHECCATVEKLNSTLFRNAQPFQGPTAVMLEVSALPPGPYASSVSDAEGSYEEELLYPRRAKGRGEASGEQGEASVQDPDRLLYTSTFDPERTVAAFALTFPNYSTFLACPGLYLEDLFVRDEYRALGLGTCLLRFLARVAQKQGMGRLEWSVLDWNVNAIQFYTQRMGAQLMHEWRICRLEGASLEAASEAPRI